MRTRDEEKLSFSIEHALALLRRNSVDWKISEPNYSFTNNEIVKNKPVKKEDGQNGIPNNRNTQKSQTGKSNQKG